MAVTISAADQALINDYQKRWKTAQAGGDTKGMEDAHSAAEGIRGKYGYSGGADGSAYIPVPGSQPGGDTPAADGFDFEKYITELYDGYTGAQQQALLSAYEQNVNELNAAAAKLPMQYQTARNQAAAQSETQRANFNEYAAARGLSSGAGGQAQLAMGNQLQSNLSGISQAEADTLADLELQRTQLAAKYKNDIAQALADGSFKKAEALYDNYWREIERR